MNISLVLLLNHLLLIITPPCLISIFSLAISYVNCLFSFLRSSFSLAAWLTMRFFSSCNSLLNSSSSLILFAFISSLSLSVSFLSKSLSGKESSSSKSFTLFNSSVISFSCCFSIGSTVVDCSLSSSFLAGEGDFYLTGCYNCFFIVSCSSGWLSSLCRSSTSSMMAAYSASYMPTPAFFLICFNTLTVLCSSSLAFCFASSEVLDLSFSSSYSFSASYFSKAACFSFKETNWILKLDLACPERNNASDY